jgi:hypothetical protein
MIQKIRSYLLDNEDHKESIGWYVVIIMLAPILSIFFQYRKQNSIYLGSVNGKKIEKSIYNIKLYEQSSLFENIKKMFGEEQANYFFNMLFQGKGLEEYVLSGEIKRVFLHTLYEKLISSDVISEDFILANVKSKSFDKIKKSIGELPFLLITKQIKASDLSQLKIDMNVIDNFCQEAFQVDLLKNLFFVPLSAIEKSVFVDYPALPIRVAFIEYKFDLTQNNYRNAINKEMISDYELHVFYDKGVKNKQYRKNRTLAFSVSRYDLPEDAKTKDKELNRSEEIKNRWNIISSDSKQLSLSELKTTLSKHFVLNQKSIEKDVAIVFSNSNDLLKIHSSPWGVSSDLKEKVVSSFLEHKDDFFSFIFQDKIYLVEHCSCTLDGTLDFEEARNLVLSDIVMSRADQNLLADIDLIRYALELGESVAYSGWKKNDVSFTRNKEDKKDTAFNDIVLQKLSMGGLRKGSSFVVLNEKEYSVYFVSDITYEEQKRVLSSRKDMLYNKEIYVESLERLAKIDLSV